VAGKWRLEGWGLNGDAEVPVVFQSVVSYPQLPTLFFSVDYARASMRGSAENFAPKNRVQVLVPHKYCTGAQRPAKRHCNREL